MDNPPNPLRYAQANELLRQAAALIQTGGFTQGYLARNAQGQGVYPTHPTARLFGIDGALTKVCAGVDIELERIAWHAVTIAASLALGTQENPYWDAIQATEHEGMDQERAVALLLAAQQWVPYHQEADRMTFEPGWAHALVARKIESG